MGNRAPLTPGEARGAERSEGCPPRMFHVQHDLVSRETPGVKRCVLVYMFHDARSLSEVVRDFGP